MRSGSLFVLVGAASAARFGPKHCVEVLRNTKRGTCVFRTACETDADLDKVQFSFLCDHKGEMTEHDFGVGGFGAREEFDTGIQCNRCTVAAANVAAAASSGKHALLRTHREEAAAGGDPSNEAKKDEAKKDEAKKGEPKKDEPNKDEAKNGKSKEAEVPEGLVHYGPDNCVSTHRDAKTKTCVIETACSLQQLKDYEVGVVCVEENDETTRHVFGINSFSPKEIFNSYIECKACLGLDDVVEDLQIAKEMASIETSVAGLKSDMKSVKDSVASLKGEVAELKKGGAAPAASPETSNAPADGTVSASQTILEDDDE